jgi:hypothetical protein
LPDLTLSPLYHEMAAEISLGVSPPSEWK